MGGSVFSFASCHKYLDEGTSPNVTKSKQPARFIPRGLSHFQPPIPHQPDMIPHLQKYNPHPCQPTLTASRLFPGRRNRKWLLLPLAALVAALAFTSCSGGYASSPPPPPVPVTDTRPVGEGLKLVGFAVLGAAVVTVLGRLIR